jgi:hypothetical protein
MYLENLFPIMKKVAANSYILSGLGSYVISVSLSGIDMIKTN